MFRQLERRLAAAVLAGTATLFAGSPPAEAVPHAADLARPDLRIARVVLLPDGHGFLVGVENAGRASSRPTCVVLRKGSGSEVRRVAEAEVVALAPDGLAFVQLVPAAEWGGEPEQVASLCVDPAQLVEESVETNNDATWVAP